MGYTRNIGKIIICYKCNKIGNKYENDKSHQFWKNKTREDFQPILYKSNELKNKKGKECMNWRRNIGSLGMVKSLQMEK